MLHIKGKDDCTPIKSNHGEIVYELMGNATGGTSQHSLAHIEIPPGRGSMPHHHPQAEESYYILSGEARLIVDGETHILRAGQSVAITPGMVHQILNDQDETLHFLAVCAPAWTPDNSVYID